jgi:DNA-binding NarL/FixJ family response regulator
MTRTNDGGTLGRLKGSTHSRPPTVLLVDDHAAFRAVARTVLEDAGLAVIAVLTDAASVVSEAAALRPDVVLLDIRLPDGDGVQVAAELAVAAPDALVVLTSSMTVADARERLAAAGSSARFLPKARLSGPALLAILDG